MYSFLNDSYATYIDSKLKTIKEDKEFFTLMENMYKNPYVDRMTEIIQTVINEYVKKSSLTKNGYKDFNLKDKKLISLFKSLENAMNKAFNIKVNIRINNEYPDSIRFGACIFINPEDFKEAEKEIEEIVKENKTDLQFVKINKCDIWIQEYLFKFIHKNGLNARHITAVLLHEIGHKLYLRFNNKIEQEHQVIDFILAGGQILTFLVGSTGIIIGGLGYLFAVLSVPVLIFLTTSRNVNDINSYSETEGNCDYNAITFGYGKEIYELFVFFESSARSKGYILTKKNFIRKIFSTDYKRREIMYNNIVKEINNPNNSEKEREELKQTLKYIDELIDKYKK